MTKLELLRREKDLSQMRLSRIAGVSQKTISAYETEKSIIDNARLKTLCKFAKALNVKIANLVDDATKEMLISVCGYDESKHDPWSEGSRMVEMRHEMKITQQELADELFMSQSRIAKWECYGVENLSICRICQLCISLACHPCDLIDDKNLRDELRGVLL